MSNKAAATIHGISAMKKRRQMKKRKPIKESTSSNQHLSPNASREPSLYSSSSRSDADDFDEEHFFKQYQSISATQRGSTISYDAPIVDRNLQRPPYIKLNIGGTSFRFDISKLRTAGMQRTRLFLFVRYSHLMRLAICKDYLEDTNEYFFERSANLFKPIYIFYLTGEVTSPAFPCERLFQEEIQFWGMSELFQPRCCKRHQPAIQEQEPKKTRSKSKQKHKKTPEKLDTSQRTPQKQDPFENVRLGDTRRAVWYMLEKPSSSRCARALNWALLVALLFSNVALVLGSMEQFQDSQMQPNPMINLVEAGCVAMFTAEYLSKILVHPQRFRIARQALNVIDLLAILPFFIETTFDYYSVNSKTFQDISSALLVVRVVRVLRVVRLVKLGRYSTGMRLLAKTIGNAYSLLLMMFSILLLSIVFCATLMYFVEREDERSDFTNIPKSFWWALVTVTTVGYGDMVPQTVAGKCVASLTIAWGIVALALPVTVVMQTFMEMQERLENARQGIE